MSENNPHTERSASGNDTRTGAPLPGSRKVYLHGRRFEDVRVPMREIRLSGTTAKDGQPAESPETVFVYDTSGPYTDPDAKIDLSQGLEPVRLKWIQARGGKRIDWVLFNRRLDALEAGIDRRDFDGRYPSDHFPVTATLRIRPVTSTGAP